jgi:hypothetical protein
MPGVDAVASLRALRFAAETHRNQHREDAEASPYINHACRDADPALAVLFARVVGDARSRLGVRP